MMRKKRSTTTKGSCASCKKSLLKDATTQTETYVNYMPLPIIIDIKSENDTDSDNDTRWDANDEPHIIEHLKVEIHERNPFECDQQKIEIVSMPVLPIENGDIETNDDSNKYNDKDENIKELQIRTVKSSKKRQRSQQRNITKTKRPSNKLSEPKCSESVQKSTAMIQCSLCKFTCKRPSHFKRHMLMHTGEKPHHCEHCPKQFAQKSDLNRHMSTHAVHYNFHCASCGRGFPDEAAAKNHQNKCKTKRYVCEQCKYMTFSIGNLLLHQRRHTGERPFACEVCDKRFTRVSHYNQHIKLHANDFEHHCGMCGRGFRDEEDMLQHESSCKNRMFQCHMCRDVHVRMDNLKRHIKITHMGEKEVMCEFCSKQFPAKSSLSQHIRFKHPERL